MISRKLFCLLVALAGVLEAAEGKPALPNIVYVLADDLGYGDVQALNPERGKIKTPHLDRLAAQGMVFTDAHSGSSVCTPTRYGLLTGHYAWRTRLQRGVLDGGSDEPLIAADRLTVPALLKSHGYHSACIGKWHLGFVVKPPADAVKPLGKNKMGFAGSPVGSEIVGGPVTRGFDFFLGVSNARTMASLVRNDRVAEMIEPVDVLPRLEKEAVAYLTERAAEAKTGKPFFLYLPLTSPHTPIVPAPVWRGKSGLGDYADFVMQTDAVVGGVLKALETNGLAENTLVIFTADNGCSPQAGVGALEKAGHYPSAQLRGYKSDIWDGGHRVPFIVRWPGQVKAGGRSPQLLCHTDLMATCAELLAAKLPDNAGEDSISFLPALLGRSVPELRQSVVHHSIEGMFALRQGPWKLALGPGSGGWGKGGADQPVQLYDLAADLSETNNLAAAKPAEAARLTALLASLVAEGRSTPGPRQANDVTVNFLKAAKPKTTKAQE